MAEQVLIDAGIWIDGLDFAGVSNEVSMAAEAEAPERTVFKGEWRRRAPGGLKSASFSLGGFFEAVEIDEAQLGSLGNRDSVLVVPAGQSPGEVAYVVPMIASAYQPGASIGELLAFTYAGESDGIPIRGRVFDVREDITADVDQPRQQFGAIPVGHVQKVFIHVKAISGSLQIDLMSADMAAGGTLTMRGQTPAITTTGVYELVVSSGMLAPVTDQYWFLRYDVTGASDFDVAAASVFGERHTIIPPTPITPPPTPGTVTLRGGLSANAIPTAAELNIDGTGANMHLLAFAPFTNQRVLIARRASQGDITSVVLQSDPTALNQVGAFSKFGSTVTVGGVAYSVWVSNQALTFANAETFEVQ